MTDNQFNQLFGLVTKCVNGIQKLETDVTELKTDVAELKTDVAELKGDVAELKQGQAELKEGQFRLEKEMRMVNHSVGILAKDNLDIRTRLDLLEDQQAVKN